MTHMIPRNRTLPEEKSSNAYPDKADSIRRIDVHTIPIDLVYQRFSTSPALGLETPAVASLTQIYGKNVISPPKDSVLEKRSQLRFWRVQLPHVDRIHCHNSKPPRFLLWTLVMNTPFSLIQLSYKPLGEPNPAIFNLGVAILLVRLFRKSYWVRCITYLPVHLL